MNSEVYKAMQAHYKAEEARLAKADANTPAGFSWRKVTGEVASDAIFRASENLHTVTSIIVQTCPVGDELAEAIRSEAEELRKRVWELKEKIDGEFRGLGK